ncbi:MAG: bifunctional metallophosphatase/5'-nucleotidase [Victivallales bacterium]|nr:bifunctional metallophosphatase/5'-nucleotidase [Victivallales bacterium]
MKRLLAILCLLASLLALAEPRTITIFQTTDSHARLKGDSPDKPGWPQLATLLKQEIKQAGDNNWLLVDCGDTVQGTLIGSLSRGEAGLVPIRTLPYDVWVPGNHELDFGPDRCQDFFESMSDRLLCANFQIQGKSAPTPWKMFERNGLRIAVIGLQATYFSQWLLPEDYARCKVQMGTTVLKKVLPEIHAQKPDVIVLAAHQAWLGATDTRQVNQITTIAKTFPEIDLILGGHSHREVPGAKIGVKPWYVQAGCHCTCFAVVQITADNETHEVLSIQSRLVPIPADTPPDPELQTVLRPWLEQEKTTEESLTGIVLSRPVSPSHRPGYGCQTSDLLAQAIAAATGAEIAFHSRLTNAWLPEGPLTYQQLFQLVPYDNIIVSAMLTPQEITEVMNEQWTQRETYRFCGPWNARFHVKNHVLTLLGIGPDNTPPDPNRRYKVAFNSHTAAGTGYFNRLKAILASPEAQTQLHRVYTRDVLVNFLKTHPYDPTQTVNWITR